jgi:hypothetical protein
VRLCRRCGHPAGWHFSDNRPPIRNKCWQYLLTINDYCPCLEFDDDPLAQALEEAFSADVC